MKLYQTISRRFQVVTLITLVLAFGLGSTIAGAASTSSTLDYTSIDAYVAAQMEEQGK